MAKVLLGLVALLAATPALADEKLWSLLKGGGSVTSPMPAGLTPGA